MNTADLIKLATKYIGSKYVLGAYVPKDDKDYKGAFDCAEYVAFLNYQIFNVLFGTELNNFSRKNSDDAYTGYFARDAQKLGVIISVEEAIRTEGAMLLRIAKGSAVGHIAISKGNGKTLEAHSSKYGVIESKADGRRWDYGILLPSVQYVITKSKIASKAPAIVYRLKTPMMVAPFIGVMQKALKVQGYYTGKIDDTFDKATDEAISAFQSVNGLIVDGEVMPNGETARALGI